MKFIRKLTNPFALTAQGFVLGAVLFGVSAPRDQAPTQTVVPVSAYQIPAA